MGIKGSGQWLLILGACAAGVLSTARAHATQYNASPSGSCTLPLAIQAVNTQSTQGGCVFTGVGPDSIVLQAGTYNITSALHILKPVVIRGATSTSMSSTIVRANLTTSGADFITVHPAATPTAVTFQDVTVEKGSAQVPPEVAGIYVFSIGGNTASLKVTRCRIAGHTWSGLYSLNSWMEVTDSIVENNSSPESGGGIHVHSTLPNAGGVNTDRTQISNNTSPDLGGGIYFAGNAGGQIRDTTISGNSASQGGGVAYESPDEAYFNLINTTVTHNTAVGSAGGVYTLPFTGDYDPNIGTVAAIIADNTSNFSPDWEGYLHASTSSLVGNTSGMEFGALEGNNLFDVDPMLDPVLRALGGPTKVHRLLPGSPAIDAVADTDSASTTDQRGVFRPQLGGSDPNMKDMGAYEARLESEILQVANKTSSVTHSIVTQTGCSEGKGTNLQSTAIGQFVTYATPSTPAGTYTLVAGYKKGSTGGKFRVATAQTLAGTYTNRGAVQNGNASSNTWTSVNLGNVTFSSIGVKFIRFTVTDTAGQIFPDYIELRKP